MILQRFITNQVAIIYIQVMAVVLAIFLMRFISLYLFYLSDGFIQATDFLMLLAFRVLSSLDIISQFSIVTAIFITFYKFSKSNELLTLSVIGMSQSDLIRNLIPLWMIIILISGTLTMIVSPTARQYFNNIKETSNDISLLDVYPAGTFNAISAVPEIVMHAKKSGSNERYYKDVFIQFERNRQQVTITAKRARQVVDSNYKIPYFLLFDGNQYVGKPGDSRYSVSVFSELAIRIPIPSKKIITYLEKDKTTSMLWSSKSLESSLELQSRLHTPISTVLLLIFILLIIRNRPRHSNNLMIVLAACIYFIYAYFYYTVLGSWLSKSSFSPVIGYWVFELLFSVGIAVFAKFRSVNTPLQVLLSRQKKKYFVLALRNI